LVSGGLEYGARAILGYFNTGRYTDEKIGGKRLSLAQFKDFIECFIRCGLSDIRSSGGYWTWNNNTHGAQRISWRLDRMLANSQ
jgi:hypothetical protein